MFANYEALIFDMDGTLIDSGKLHENAWIQTLTKFNIPIDRVLMRSLSGMSTDQTLQLLIERFEVETSLSSEEMANYKASLIVNDQSCLLRATTLLTVVEEYYEKLPMSVGTGATSAEAIVILESCGLKHYMQHIVGSDKVTNHKPAPDTFLLCAELMGVAPSKCVVFEDSPLGIQAGNAANMLVCDVSKEYRIKNDYFL